MTDELKVALEKLSTRGTARGGRAVTARALDIAMPLTHPAPRARRALPRLTAAAALAVVTVLVVGAVYVRTRSAQIDRVDLSTALDGPTAAPGVTTVLVVGTDKRAGVEGERADLIMLVRVDSGTRRAAVLSVPRDLYVPIAGTERSDRVSTAFARDAESLITTVKAALGVEVDHYMQVDFDGFRTIVDRANGVKLRFPAPTRDQLAGFDAPAGCVTLDGDGALAFARSRHLETLEEGRWRADPSGDLGRIRRQQQLVLAALAGIVDRVNRDSVALNGAVDAVVSNVTVDDGLSMARLLQLSKELVRLDRSFITMLTLPVTTAKVGEAVVLELDRTALLTTIEQFEGAAPPPIEATTLPPPAITAGCG